MSIDMEEGRVNCFLGQYKLSDAVLAPILDKLARFEGQPIDYSFLGVRQLGSIYEGLLEYRIVIEGESVHLENDRGERKATGSYYTPDYIVKYIVSHTLKPILEQRARQFGDVMTEIATRRQESSDRRLGNLSQQGLQKELQRLEKKAITTLLDLKLCDPAMGSGHFLVEAVDYLTDELIQILNLYPEDNPVLTMLETTRQNIIDNLRQQGIILDSPTLEPTQLLQRVVMKRCIYGVDINPMAVELAKVSLWLHSFTVGAPLSFLDHHLRCGNSLIGTTAKAAEAAMIEEESGQLTLLTGPFVGLLRAAEIMRGISTLSDATFAEVEASEQLFRDFDSQAKPYKRLLDVFLSRFFGVKTAIEFLQRYGGNISAINWDKLPPSDQRILDQAASLYKSKCFFHWDLEFPEVFIDLDSAAWKDNPGFDAVIGNPPWGCTLSKEEKKFLQNYFKINSLNNLDSYALFTQASMIRTNQNGRCGHIIPDTLLRKEDLRELRKHLIFESTIEELIETGPVFKEVRDTWCLILIVTHQQPSKYHRIQHKKISRFIVSAEERLERFGLQEWSQNTKSAQLQWARKQDHIIGYNASRCEQSIIQKIENNSETLRNSSLKFIISRGEEGSKQKLTPDPTGNFMIVIPEDINRYEINDGVLIKSSELTPIKMQKFYSCPKIWCIRIQKLRWKQRIVCSFDPRDNSAGMKTLQIIISSSNQKDNLLFASTLLSSKLLNFWCEDYLVDDMNKSYLEKIPIRKISFSTNSDRRQQCLEKLIKSYQEKQEILKEIEEHIRREETDIVHDILSYLAEQMIEINREKQKEIKSFLRYLERIIGSAIDNLTNKSKIQNYLGDYQKSEPHLSLDQLWEILKKNKKKISVNLLDRQIQETLEKEYQTSLEKLLPLKQQLSATDELIDLIVYKLYGLSEEEIKIIEGRE